MSAPPCPRCGVDEGALHRPGCKATAAIEAVRQAMAAGLISVDAARIELAELAKEMAAFEGALDPVPLPSQEAEWVLALIREWLPKLSRDQRMDVAKFAVREDDHGGDVYSFYGRLWTPVSSTLESDPEGGAQLLMVTLRPV